MLLVRVALCDNLATPCANGNQAAEKLVANVAFAVVGHFLQVIVKTAHVAFNLDILKVDKGSQLAVRISGRLQQFD